MRRLFITILVLLALAAPVQAIDHTQPVVIEAGATFLDNGVCVEADGTTGLSMADGQCVTPADYDIMFGYDVLSQTPTFDPFDGDQTVAEAYDIQPDVASTRPRDFMGVSIPTFAEAVKLASGRWIL